MQETSASSPGADSSPGVYPLKSISPTDHSQNAGQNESLPEDFQVTAVRLGRGDKT